MFRASLRAHLTKELTIDKPTTRPGFVPVVIIVAVVTGGLARAEDPPPVRTRIATASEAERARRLKERDRCREDARRLLRAGKRDEAFAAIDKTLAIERQVLGEFHEDVVKSLLVRASAREGYGEWDKARADLKDVLSLRERQPGHKDWQVADARRATH